MSREYLSSRKHVTAEQLETRRLLAAGSVQWTKQLGSSSADEFGGIAVDASGSIYVAGTTPGAWTGTSVGGTDGVIRKYDSAGNEIWTRQFGTATNEQIKAAAVDSLGNLYVGGSTTGKLGALSYGATDAFVRKYDPTGNVLWTQQFGTASTDRVFGLTIDKSGNAVAVGETGAVLGAAKFGSTDAFARKFDASGNVLWTHQFGTSDAETAEAVAADGAGNLYVVGRTRGDMEGANAGYEDVFVRKIASAGTAVWTRQFGSYRTDLGHAVCVDSAGAVYVGGYTGDLLPGAGGTASDAFVRKYDASGNTPWTKQFGTAYWDDVWSMATDTAGNVYLAGDTHGTLGSSSLGPPDGFVRAINPSGTPLWTAQIGSNTNDGGRGVAVSPNGSVVTGGWTAGSLQGTTLGLQDLWVGKLEGSAMLPTVSIAATDATASENGADTGLYTVSRTTPTTAALTVNLTISGSATNGTDYATIPATLTIPAGAASATIKLTAKADSASEATETAILTLAAGKGYVIDAAKKAATVNITNVASTTASIAGSLYHDFDGDSTKDAGESALSAWTVFIDADKDGVLDTGEKSATTSTTGGYSFAGLASGTYRVRPVIKSGWVGVSALYQDLTVAGANLSGKNFAVARPVTVSGNVFKDLNADGFRDANETAISGWTVFVDTDKDGVLDASETKVLTDASGNFSLKGLKPGTFSVRLIVGSGYTATTPIVESVVLRSGATLSGLAFGAKL